MVFGLIDDCNVAEEDVCSSSPCLNPPVPLEGCVLIVGRVVRDGDEVKRIICYNLGYVEGISVDVDTGLKVVRLSIDMSGMALPQFLPTSTVRILTIDKFDDISEALNFIQSLKELKVYIDTSTDVSVDTFHYISIYCNGVRYEIEPKLDALKDGVERTTGAIEKLSVRVREADGLFLIHGDVTFNIGKPALHMIEGGGGSGT